MTKKNLIYSNLGSYGTCPECGGRMMCTAVADECTSCSYYQYYGGNA